MGGREVRTDLTHLESRDIWRYLAEDPGSVDRVPMTAVASVPRSAVVGLIASADPFRWAIQAHAGSGVVRFRLMTEWEPEPIMRAIAEIRSRAEAIGGSLILSRCPTEWKDRLGVWGNRRGDWTMMEKIKAALDPAGVMNPGRFVGTI